MNKILLLFFLIASFQLIGQEENKRFCKIYLKSGEVIETMLGKRKGKHFIHNDLLGSKPQKVAITSIDFVVMSDAEGTLEKLRFLSVKGKRKIQTLHIVSLGSLELYKSQGSKKQNNSEVFYVKRKGDNAVSCLEGTEDNKKNILLEFAKDCPKLKEKINSEKYSVSKDIFATVKLFNIYCASK
ncbi:MAG: hypothetical protein R2776_00165 [Flavobacteriaceae bacterium]|nr:hypothetical protein [Flavobacteriaceae bacterium]